VTRTPGTPRLLRAINDRTAIGLLLDRGPLSKAQLAALTGLSKPTASQLLDRLEEAGYVIRVGQTAGGRGPNAQLYAVNSAASYVAAVEVSPRQITAAVADITGSVLSEYAHLVNPGGGEEYDPVPDVRKAVVGAVAQAGIRVRDLSRVVMGAPGAHNPSKDSLLIADQLHSGWARPGLMTAIRRRFGIPVEIENDVNASAVAERNHGVAEDAGSFVLLWVSNGVGLAIDIGGALHRGATGGAGEIGYMPIANVPGIGSETGTLRVADYQNLIGAPAVLRLARLHGVTASTAKSAVTKAVALGPDGEPFLTELAVRLATGLATIVAVLDPELVVLTGDTCRAGGEAFRVLVEEELRASSPLLHPKVMVTGVEGNSVLRGALDLALEQARDEVFGMTALTSVIPDKHPLTRRIE
jgi:predicted NBD/HSP70 family sugar kinase/biotin operon repressor